ncbi:MAG: 16S rRNA (cytosine(1402)-N(4))-methyltransferase RsmH, partial [Acidobacteria bacterium]|nr:16S rRNA (cytosine(1402)-N(4))-methyltransferase RsmH [Acidobacteriota bacterium]
MNPSRRDSTPRHQAVLLRETLELLAPPRGGTVIDCTVGMGGHTRALLEAVGPSGRVVGLDRDSESLALATESLWEFGDCFIPLHADYRDLPRILTEGGFGPVHALLADFGFSSFQMDSPERGFSFSSEGPLDMRLDRSRGLTAAQLLAAWDEAELARALKEYGEEHAARRIAKAVAREQQKKAIVTTLHLARVVEAAIPAARRFRIHPATRTFQALRIAVNRELEGLEEFVEQACRMLGPRGRAAFISFHSLEDRAVKHTLAKLTP